MFKASTNKKISLALGIVTAVGAAALVLGPIWGFDALATQIFQSITGLAAVVNIYFLGSTSEKLTTGKK